MMTSSNICRLLERKFCQPEWALFFEVASATGAVAARRADAIAMNLYPSRGLAIHGFEIKISRSDWLRELKDPAKAEPVMRNCDHWWIVAPKGIVAPGELPPTWGHYVVDGRGVTCETKAPKLENGHIDPTRHFMAALIRRAGEFDQAQIDARVRKETERVRAEAEERIARRLKDSTRTHNELQEQVFAFEKASGIKLSAYVGGAELGKAVALVQLLGGERCYRTVEGLRNTINNMGDELTKALAAFEKG